MEDETSNIIIQMFAYNLDEILQNVFLFLDPVSLKNAQSVCHQWNQFIRNRLWGSKVARKKLLSLRLWSRWRNVSNMKMMKYFRNSKSYVQGLACDENFVYISYVQGLACDENFVYCHVRHGIRDGFIEVYCLSTGQCVNELDCNYGTGRRAKFDVGVAEIGTMDDRGNVCVFDKIKGEILYKDKHRGSLFAFEIKVISRGAVVTGGDDGSLVLIMANQDNKWNIVNKFTDLTEYITHIDSDGDWVVTGTCSAVFLWKFISNSLVLDPRSVEIELVRSTLGMMNCQRGRFTFSFPFIFVCGGYNWEGLQVWNIESKEMVRHLNLSGQRFTYIESNWRFLSISSSRIGVTNGSVVIFDKTELCDSKISEDNLWRYSRKYIGSISAVINTTSLVVSNGNFNSSISVQNVWDVSE